MRNVLPKKRTSRAKKYTYQALETSLRCFFLDGYRRRGRCCVRSFGSSSSCYSRLRSARRSFAPRARSVRRFHSRLHDRFYRQSARYRSSRSKRLQNSTQELLRRRFVQIERNLVTHQHTLLRSFAQSVKKLRNCQWIVQEYQTLAHVDVIRGSQIPVQTDQTTQHRVSESTILDQTHRDLKRVRQHSTHVVLRNYRFDALIHDIVNQRTRFIRSIESFTKNKKSRKILENFIFRLEIIWKVFFYLRSFNNNSR